MKILEKFLLIILLGASCIAAVLINVAVFLIEEHVQLPADIITVTATNAAPDYGPQNVLDDDISTIWHTSWGSQQAELPQSLIFEFESAAKLSEISVLPRQDMENGRIAQFNVYIKNDGDFKLAVQDGFWDYSEDIGYQVAAIDPPAVATAVKLEVVYGLNGFASAAEVKFKGVIVGARAEKPSAEESRDDLPFSDINFTPSDRSKLGIYVDDQHPDYLGKYILDGDTVSFWHTDWMEGDKTFPFRIYVNLGGEHSVTGLRFLNRQDGSENGNISICALYSENGLEAANISPVESEYGNYREIPLENPITATVLIIEVTEAYGEFASMAELSILTNDAGVITPSDAFANGN